MKRTFAGWMCCIGLVAMLEGGIPAAGSAPASALGQGGTAPVVARDTITLSEQSSQGDPSGLFSTTTGPGQGGDIVLQAPTIQRTVGATISARSIGTGTAGSLRIREADTLRLSGTTIDVLPYSGGIGKAKLVAQGAAQLTLSALPFHTAEASPDDQADEEQSIPADEDAVEPESRSRCRYYRRHARSGQLLFLDACLERLPGGIRASYHFYTNSGRVRVKGTLHTCTFEFGCRHTRRAFYETISDKVFATQWASTCPRVANWWGVIERLDIRFASGELHRGTGPYITDVLYTTAC